MMRLWAMDGLRLWIFWGAFWYFLMLTDKINGSSSKLDTMSHLIKEGCANISTILNLKGYGCSN
jgi:hypothetical protein